ncbi:MAG: type VI secretion system-associated protein TagF [Caulobacteraceae bacterium]
MSGARAFIFGKLPRHGDFVARGLTAEARNAWDAWLSVALERARGDFGAEFETAHEASPAWRFVLGPGALGPTAQAGALAPSIDAADRRFFIVVGGRDLASEAGEAVAARMEALIHRAFQENLDAEALSRAAQEALGEAAGESAPAAPQGDRWWLGEALRDSAPARLIISPAEAEA